ncbi:MAG: site-2 protease family protein [Planctomycetota bacterium]|nr:site-2 protease family protein [Planctomycetota bacterium]
MSPTSRSPGVQGPGAPGEGAGPDWGGRPPRSEDPMSWSIPLSRLGRTEIRVHVFFLLFSLVELVRALISEGDPGISMPLGFFWTAASLIFLWWIVLAHELGHVAMASWLGGRADEVLMWPLGGLATARAPAGWWPSLLVAIAGPLVNVAIFLVLGVVLYLQTGDFACVFPSVFSTGGLTEGIVVTSSSNVLTTLFIIHWVNGLVLVFSSLPSYPLDGARALHALLWRRLGYTRALTWTARVGFLVAILLGVTALLTTEGIYAGYLVALAFFCGFCCQRELNRMRFTESELEVLDHEELGTWAPEDREEGVVGRINAPGGGVHPDGTAEESAAVDRILDKIRSGGMKSLSRAERRLLKRASKRRRRP